MGMRFDAVSVIPQVFDPYLDASVLGRARARGVYEFCSHDLRTWTHDRHRTVDDAPFGGGQGMLMKPEPIFEAVDAVCAMAPEAPHVVFFSPVGRPFDQQMAERMASLERVVYVCGRYEGMDERVYDLADEVISLGDYVLTGGELAALAVTDAVVRLLPGALGDDMSARDESFSQGLLEYAQYTRPSTYRGSEVPEVLLSGDHGAIARWRHESALARTARWRPDLLATAALDDADRAFLNSLDFETYEEGGGAQEDGMAGGRASR